MSEAVRTTGQDPKSAIRDRTTFNLDLEQDLFSWADGEYAVALIEDAQGPMRIRACRSASWC